jgi:ParB family chromosome partitioning protein
MKSNRVALGRGLASLISSKPVPVTPPRDRGADGSSGVSAGVTTQHRNPQNHDSATTTSTSAGNAALAVAPDQTIGTASEQTPQSLGNPSESGVSTAEGVRYLPIEQLRGNPHQPRKEFAEVELKELSDSIRTLGVLQPILVRAESDTNLAAGSDRKLGYEIVAGERRFRAAQRAGLTKVPVIIRHLSEREVVEIALVENVQRADLSPLEEAQGYNRLSEEFGLTQREIAERVGKDRATIANFLRLLSLPPPVIELLRKGEISMGHAKAILTVREPAVQVNLAKKIVAEGLSVRAIEAIVSRSVAITPTISKSKEPQKTNAGITPEVAAVIDRLRSRLGTKVSVSHHASGRGKIEVEYFSFPELERLMELIGG